MKSKNRLLLAGIVLVSLVLFDIFKQDKTALDVLNNFANRTGSDELCFIFHTVNDEVTSTSFEDLDTLNTEFDFETISKALFLTKSKLNNPLLKQYHGDYVELGLDILESDNYLFGASYWKSKEGVETNIFIKKKIKESLYNLIAKRREANMLVMTFVDNTLKEFRYEEYYRETKSSWSFGGADTYYEYTITDSINLSGATPQIIGNAYKIFFMVNQMANLTFSNPGKIDFSLYEKLLLSKEWVTYFNTVVADSLWRSMHIVPTKIPVELQEVELELSVVSNPLKERMELNSFFMYTNYGDTNWNLKYNYSNKLKALLKKQIAKHSIPYAFGHKLSFSEKYSVILKNGKIYAVSLYE